MKLFCNRLIDSCVVEHGLGAALHRRVKGHIILLRAREHAKEILTGSGKEIFEADFFSCLCAGFYVLAGC